MKRRQSILMIVIALISILLGGCNRSPPKTADLIAFIANAQRTKYPVKPKTFKKDLIMQGWIFTLATRSPFLPVAIAKVRVIKPTYDVFRYPLVQFLLNDLKLVGIVIEKPPRGNYVIFIAPNKKIYTVSRGDLIGKVGAQIIKIDYNGVIVKIIDVNGIEKKLILSLKG